VPEWNDEGIVLSARPHGESGAVVSLLTRARGRAAGYVYGAASARTRGVIEPGNFVSAHWQAKAAEQLGNFALELEKSALASVLGDALKLTALQSACALADKVLPEGEPHPGVFEGLKALISAFDTEVWPAVYIYWELGLLKDIGFGLDLSKCAVTGETENLTFVSPKTGRAVTRAGAGIYADKMLRLPGFMSGGGLGEDDVTEGLKLTGHFLLNRVFSLSNENLPDARLRLEEKFSRLNS
jgi:DNA repair protein RecO (recombination protein O)